MKNAIAVLLIAAWPALPKDKPVDPADAAKILTLKIRVLEADRKMQALVQKFVSSREYRLMMNELDSASDAASSALQEFMQKHPGYELVESAESPYLMLRKKEAKK